MLHRRWPYILPALVLIATLTPALAEDDADRLLAGAQADLSDGNPRAAAAKLEHALQTRPDWTSAHRLLALAQQELGREDEALAEYRVVQAASWPCPTDPDDAQPALSTAERAAILDAEARLMYLVNRERGTKGLALLRPHPLMSIAARGHSEEMRDRSYFSHMSPVSGHETPLDRFMAVFRQSPMIIAENISHRWGDRNCFNPANVDRSHDGLMASPGHRANILMSALNSLGVGVAVSDTGAFWITELFAQLRSKETSS